MTQQNRVEGIDTLHQLPGLQDADVSAADARSGEDAAERSFTANMSRRGLLGAGLLAAGSVAWSDKASAQSAKPPEKLPAAPSSPVRVFETPAADKAAASAALTSADLIGAERAVGLAYTDAERAKILPQMAEQLQTLAQIHGLDLPNSLAPAGTFDPRLPGISYPAQANRVRLAKRAVAASRSGAVPQNADLAYASVAQLSQWIQAKRLKSRDLTELYLERIRLYSPQLENFINVTPELARAQADQADREIAAGRYRGALHGIPYALKDLFDAKGVETTWGAEPFVGRIASEDSAVVARLAAAGAVLLGKTAVGALAYGDIWHKGVSRNPWNPQEGSSGSSAGSASAVAAGQCAFAIGTETLGSIVSPSHRCGVTGLRPTFGRVSRYGAMALCWSLDKTGPLCRTVEDTALVLAAIQGEDHRDAGSLTHGFDYDGNRAIAGMRVGFDPKWFEGDGATDVDRGALAAMKSLGVKFVPFAMPDLSYGALGLIVEAEAAASFADLTLSNQDDQLRWQDDNAWPNIFRRVRLVPAVDYIQVDRLRRQVMLAAHQAFAGVDAVIGPNYVANMLLITNFTGHPCLCLRAGFVERQPRTLFEVPADPKAPSFRATHNVSLWAPLFEERNLIALGHHLEASLAVAAERPKGFG